MSEMLLTIVIAWIPPVILGLIGLGALKTKVDNLSRKVEKMEDSGLLTETAHEVLQSACQTQITIQIEHIKSDVKELKESIKEDVNEIKAVVAKGDERREKCRDELKDALTELTRVIISKEKE